MDKVDLKKEFKELYRATARVTRVEPDSGVFLAVDGHGEPGGDQFSSAIEHLYSVAYTLKFSLKAAGVMDFVVAPLESLWYDNPATVPDPTQWRWRAQIRIPDAVTEEQAEDARRGVREKGDFDPSDTVRIQWEEGPSVQVLHVGPYDAVSGTYDQLQAAAEADHLSLTAPGHEVYLSDLRRTEAARLKTIVRMPVTAPE